MREDKLILGYAEYNNEKYPFVYEKGILNLLPSTEDEWRYRRENFYEIFMKIYDPNKLDEWNKNICIHGLTNENKKIIFLSEGNENNNNGFIQYEIQFVYEYELDSSNGDLINGLIMQSDEIDYFFDPSRILERRLSFKENKKIEIVTAKIGEKCNDIRHCGTYNIGDLCVSVKISSYAKYKKGLSGPVIAKSQIYVDFDRSITLEDALEVVSHQELFLKYICYRKNVDIENIYTTRLDEEGLHIKEGEITNVSSHISEVDKKRKDQIITFDLLEGKMTSILQEIADGKPYLEHIPACIDKKYEYDISRIILIFCAFEREYENFFSSDTMRSERYNKSREGALELLDVFKKTCSNKKSRKDIESFRKAINNSGNSLGDCIKNAIKHHMKIMEAFLNRIYEPNDENQVDNMAQRMNSMRNHIAHGNLDIEIKAIHLLDLALLQDLIYTMRLSSMGISVISIQFSICKLMDYEIYHPTSI